MPTPDVIATLVDLAQLARRIELAAPEAPGTMATLLLERFMMVCKAQGGAILFTQARPVEHKPSIGTSAIAVNDTPPARLQPPTGAGQAVRPLALAGMEEQEVLALLERFSADGPALQSRAGEPCCLICRLPISAPLDHQQDRGAAQDIIRPDLVETRRAGARLRALPPRGHAPHTASQWDGVRIGDLPTHRRTARRDDLGGERKREGKHLPRLLAHGCRSPLASFARVRHEQGE
jgi:hypothetical protein